MRRALFRNERGVAAIEFAFVAPVFLYMTTAAIDFGYIQLVNAELQGATQVAARTVIQTKAGTSAARITIVTNKVNALMAAFNRRAGLTTTVTVARYANFSKLNPEPYDDVNKNGKWDTGETYTDLNSNLKWDSDQRSASDDMGGVGEVVKITVNFPFRPLFSYNAALYGNGGLINANAIAIIRNEPE